MRGRPQPAVGTALGVTILTVAAISGPLRAQEYPSVTLDGSIRFRGEWDGRTTAAGDDAATLSRVRLGLRATIEPRIRAYVQLQDARAWGTEGNTLTDASADQFDLHQGFVELEHGAVVARLGRQEMALGDQRLIGAVGWTNTGRSFDGARALGRSGSVSWTLFWMNVAEFDALLATGVHPQLNQGTSDDGWLLGGFAAAPLGPATAEFTLVADRNAVTDESYTANVRVHGARGPLLYEGAAAYQFGPDRSAFLMSGKAGVASGRGTAALQVDLLSGDDNPLDVDEKAFNTLYATNHKFYGFMDYILANPQSQGLLDAQLRGSLQLPERRALRVDLHHFRVAQARGGESTLGTELDVIGTWAFAERAGLEIGMGLFLPSQLATTVLPGFGAADDPAYWGYAQLSVRWP
jgi:hypothetical protein